jgi:hypothetical protein
MVRRVRGVVHRMDVELDVLACHSAGKADCDRTAFGFSCGIPMAFDCIVSDLV